MWGGGVKGGEMGCSGEKELEEGVKRNRDGLRRGERE